MFFEGKAQQVYHYQHERKEILKNPHPLGLQMKIAEQDQGIIHNPAEGSVSVTCDQSKGFQIVLTNTRERDIDEECIVCTGRRWSSWWFGLRVRAPHQRRRDTI